MVLELLFLYYLFTCKMISLGRRREKGKWESPAAVVRLRGDEMLINREQAE